MEVKSRGRSAGGGGFRQILGSLRLPARAGGGPRLKSLLKKFQAGGKVEDTRMVVDCRNDWSAGVIDVAEANTPEFK